MRERAYACVRRRESRTVCRPAQPTTRSASATRRPARARWLHPRFRHPPPPAAVVRSHAHVPRDHRRRTSRSVNAPGSRRPSSRAATASRRTTPPSGRRRRRWRSRTAGAPLRARNGRATGGQVASVKRAACARRGLRPMRRPRPPRTRGQLLQGGVAAVERHLERDLETHEFNHSARHSARPSRGRRRLGGLADAPPWCTSENSNHPSVAFNPTPNTPRPR